MRKGEVHIWFQHYTTWFYLIHALAGNRESSGGASPIDLKGNLPFPVTYYTLTPKQLEDNGYCFKDPGNAIYPLKGAL